MRSLLIAAVGLVVATAVAVSACGTAGTLAGGDLGKGEAWVRGTATLDSSHDKLNVEFNGVHYAGPVRLEEHTGYTDAHASLVAENGDTLECDFRNTGLATFGEEWNGGCGRANGTQLMLQIGSHLHT